MAKHTKRRGVRKSRKSVKGGFLGQGNSGLQYIKPVKKLFTITNSNKDVFTFYDEKKNDRFKFDNGTYRRVKESYEVYKMEITGADEITNNAGSTDSKPPTVTLTFNHSFFSGPARAIYKNKILHAIYVSIDYIYRDQADEFIKDVKNTLFTKYPNTIRLTPKYIVIDTKQIDCSSEEKSMQTDTDQNDLLQQESRNFKSNVEKYYNRHVIPEYNSISENAMKSVKSIFSASSNGSSDR